VARAFRRKGEVYAARLDPQERAIVVGLLEQTRELLAPEVAATGDAFTDLIASLGPDFGSTADPGVLGPNPRRAEPERDRDPALDRLLPDAHRSDPAIAAEFRRLTEHDLRRRKSDTITAAIDALSVTDGDKVRLTKAQADSLLVALTDTRLLIGERLGLRNDSDVESLERRIVANPEHPLAFAAAVYDFLTWLQDSLAGALMGRRLF
jgi:hypothetical protein